MAEFLYFQILRPTLSFLATVVVAPCLLIFLIPRLPPENLEVWRRKRFFCVLCAGVLCCELVLAPPEPPDPLFLLFTHCSLRSQPSLQTLIMSEQGEEDMDCLSGKPSWILSTFLTYMLLLSHACISFETTAIVDLLFITSRVRLLEARNLNLAL